MMNFIRDNRFLKISLILFIGIIFFMKIHFFLNDWESQIEILQQEKSLLEKQNSIIMLENDRLKRDQLALLNGKSQNKSFINWETIRFLSFSELDMIKDNQKVILVPTQLLELK